MAQITVYQTPNNMWFVNRDGVEFQFQSEEEARAFAVVNAATSFEALYTRLRPAAQAFLMQCSEVARVVQANPQIAIAVADAGINPTAVVPGTLMSKGQVFTALTLLKAISEFEGTKIFAGTPMEMTVGDAIWRMD